MLETAGDLMSVERGIVVHGCNAQGVMGSGVAKAVRERYPEAYETYRAAYEQNGNRLELGSVVWHRVSVDPPLAIANAITQKHYGRDPNVRYVDYEAVASCFRTIGEVARRHRLPVHYPQIGAGLGNGDWPTIAAIIERELAGVEHTLWTLPAAVSRPPRP